MSSLTPENQSRPKIGTALLIDDEELDQITFRRVLKRSGTVETALGFSDGFSALEYMRDQQETQVDVVFLDINMPGMSGFEFLDAARDEFGPAFARMVIVMLTVPLTRADRNRAERNPLIRDFLLKPLNVEHLDRIAARLATD